jgi:Fic family protein
MTPSSQALAEPVPGELRRDVKVGQHIPISAGAVPRFLKRFEEIFTPLGKSEAILSTAAAHHRLLWIHPFVDGNGRVARLMSHAVLLETLDTGAVWSVARGLARNVGHYKQHLMNCDNPRRNDLDGRGALSEEALAAFTEFFLKTRVSSKELAERYHVSRAWVDALKQRRRESGSFAPRKQTRFRRRVLEGQEDRLKALVAAQPDATLAELRDGLRTSAALATIWRELNQLDLTIKKNRPRRRTTPR